MVAIVLARACCRRLSSCRAVERSVCAARTLGITSLRSSSPACPANSYRSLILLDYAATLRSRVEISPRNWSSPRVSIS